MSNDESAAPAVRRNTPMRQHERRIAELNDRLRSTFSGGLVVVTIGIRSFGDIRTASIFAAVRRFDAFNVDNDPHDEHDFGSFTDQADRIFWKIDYYDRELTGASPDATDEAATTRVLTIMLAAEY